ncbi:MAG: lauroyl acyltransferase, partial [Gammaproteobacteria bacterium HGW-Gammaproteobacteria-12]
MTLFSQHVVPLSEPAMSDSNTAPASTAKTAFIEARNLWQEYGDL